MTAAFRTYGEPIMVTKVTGINFVLVTKGLLKILITKKSFIVLVQRNLILITLSTLLSMRSENGNE